MKTAIVNIKDIARRDPGMRIDAAFHIAYEENKEMIELIEKSSAITQRLADVLIAQPFLLKETVKSIVTGAGSNISEKNVNTAIKKYPALCAALMFKEANENIGSFDHMIAALNKERTNVIDFMGFIEQGTKKEKGN